MNKPYAITKSIGRRPVLVLGILLAISGNSALGQTVRVSGTVRNQQSAPVAAAAVRLISADSLYIASSVTDSTGGFSMACNPTEHAFLETYHLAYEPFSSPVSLLSDITVEPVLKEHSYAVQDIVVTGNANPVSMHNGNILVNVSAMPGIQDFSAAKLLSRLPGVTADNGFKLFGTKATIYINGVKQQISANALSQYLQSLPADAVASVELISLPGGKYDASTGAVIDIRLGDKMKDGYSLQISASGSLYRKDLDDAGGDAFFIIKKNRVLFNALLSYNNRNDYARGYDSTYYKKAETAQTSRMYRGGRNNVVTSTSNLTLSLNNGHTLDFNVFIYYDRDKYDTDYGLGRKVSGDETTLTNRRTESKGNDDMYAGLIKYTSPADRPFSLSAYYYGMYGGVRSDNDYFDMGLLPGDKRLYMTSDLEMVGQMHTLGADLQNKLSPKFSLQYGLKGDFNVIHDKADYFSDNAAELSGSRFRGRELILAAYAGIEYRMSNVLSLSASVRGERMNYALDQKDGRPSSKNNYTDIFPKLLFSVGTNSYSAVLGLVSGIIRPHYTYLLPGERYVNEFYSTVGNPDLKPVKYWMVAFQQTILKHLMINLRYERANNYLGGVYVSAPDDSRLYYTYLNYADLNRYSVSVTVPYTFFKQRLYGQIEGFLYHDRYGDFDPEFTVPSGRKTHYTNGYITFNLQCDFTPRFSLDGSVTWYPRTEEIQATRKSLWGLNIGASYAFLRNKSLIFGVNVSNVFDSCDPETDVYFADNFRHQFSKVKGPVINFSLKLKINKGKDVTSEYRNNTPDMQRIVR